MDAVLFDMDGLLVDTEKVWFEVESEVMERLGGVWRPEDQERMVGGSLPSTVAYMLKVSAAVADPADVAEWMLAGMIRRLTDGVELMPGAGGLLSELRRSGTPTALVTSSARAIADAVMSCVGRRHFDFVVTGDDVARTKPDPEPYLLASTLLGVSPARCVVLEDSPAGVTAATAAGCRVVAVPSVLPIPPAPGRLIVGSLLDVDVATLRELFA